MAFGSLGTIWSEIGVDIRKLDAGLMQANLKLATADKTISGFGQKLTASSTKMMIAGGLMVGAVAGVGIAAVKMAAQFETSMRNVNSISKLSESQFKALGQSVIDMSKKFPQTAKELADGLYDIASSGFQGAAGLKVLEASAKAASAGMTTTAVSAKGITAVLNAYGLEAEEAAAVSDTMFRTVDKGVITFEELSGQIGEVVGTANIAGIGFNELSGMIAYMTTKGINAAEATTALNRMMLAIITPTEEMAAVLKNAGYESGQLALEQIGLVGVMELIEKAAAGDVAAIKAISGDLRAFKAVASLTGSGIEELTGFMKDFGDTTGATNIALAEQSKALNFQLQILKNNASAIAITLGTQYIPKLTAVTKNLSEFISEHEDATVTIINLGLAVIGSIGGLLLLAGTIGKVRAAVILLQASMTPLVASFAAIGAAATQLGIQAYTYTDAIKKAKEGTQGWGEALFNLIPVFGPTIYAIRRAIEATEESTGMTEEEVEGLKELYDTTELTNIKMAMHAKAQRDSADATEENTGTQEEQIKTIDELRASYNQLIGTLFDGINATNTLQEAEWAQVAAQEAVNKLIKEGKEGTQEYEQAINELDSANQSVIESLYGVYTSTYTTKEEQEEARKKALEYGQQLVTSGQWGEEAFKSMAAQFSKSTNTEINPALDTVKEKLDIVGKTVATPKIKLDTSSFDTSLSVAINRLNALDRRMGLFSSGGIVKAMAGGGVVGNDGAYQPIMTAASGLNIPQTGRAIPILAHEGEVILNTSQQNNLANLIWGAATGKVSGGSIENNFYIDELVVREEADIYRISKQLYDLQETTKRGMGFR